MRSFSSCDMKPWVPSTCDGDLRELLMVPRVSQEFCGVGRGLSGLHWGRCNGKGPHFELRREPQCSSPVLMWFSGVYAVSTWSQVSTCVEVWNSAFLSSCQRGFRPPGKLHVGPVALSELATGASEHPSYCELILG